MLCSPGYLEAIRRFIRFRNPVRKTDFSVEPIDQALKAGTPSVVKLRKFQQAIESLDDSKAQHILDKNLKKAQARKDAERIAQVLFLTLSSSWANAAVRNNFAHLLSVAADQLEKTDIPLSTVCRLGMRSPGARMAAKTLRDVMNRPMTHPSILDLRKYQESIVSLPADQAEKQLNADLQDGEAANDPYRKAKTLFVKLSLPWGTHSERKKWGRQLFNSAHDLAYQVHDDTFASIFFLQTAAHDDPLALTNLVGVDPEELHEELNALV